MGKSKQCGGTIGQKGKINAKRKKYIKLWFQRKRASLKDGEKKLERERNKLRKRESLEVKCSTEEGRAQQMAHDNARNQRRRAAAAAAEADRISKLRYVPVPSVKERALAPPLSSTKKPSADSTPLELSKVQVELTGESTASPAVHPPLADGSPPELIKVPVDLEGANNVFRDNLTKMT